MKFYLASIGANMLDKMDIHSGQRVAFIPNAGDVYDDPYFVESDKQALLKKGLAVDTIDLNKVTGQKLQETLTKYSIIFVAGGNSFYLLEKIRSSGFQQVLLTLSESTIYIGSSAGSVVACPDIEYVSTLDDPKKSCLSEFKGMHLVDFYILPHYSPKNEMYNEIKNKLSGTKVITLTDNEMVVVQNDKVTIIRSN